MYVDTHSHIYLKDFKDDIDEVIKRSIDNGVERIYMPNVDVDSIEDVKSLALKYPKVCFPQMGLHPCYVKEDYDQQLDKIFQELSHGNYTAVGEIGIDLYWDKTFVDNQIDAFKRQIEWSRELKLPIVIHSRDSLEMTIEIVAEMQKGDLSGIFHCFGGSRDQMKQIKDLGFFMGIGGVLTFKNGGLDKILEKCELDQLVLETDAPYLTPSPHRGTRNESAYIPLVATRLAELSGKTLEEVAKVTTNNANKVYSYTPL